MTKFWIGTAGRAALVLAAAAALAACETRSQYAPYKGYAAPGGAEPVAPTSRPPTAAPPPSPSPETASGGVTGAAPSASVQTQSLPPLAGSTTAPPPSRPAVPPPAAEAPAVSPKPIARGAVQTLASEREITVAEGETLDLIAASVKTPRREIASASGLKSPYALKPGQVLTVPSRQAYVVQSGDTLSAIGRRFAVEPKALMRLNGMESTSLHVGQKLSLPIDAVDGGAGLAAAEPPLKGRKAVEPAAEVEAPAKPTTKTVYSIEGKVQANPGGVAEVEVRKGDNVEALSDRFGAAKKAIIDANKLKSPYHLRAGDTIKIPAPKAYVVESGDTLAGIAKRFDADPKVLQALNDFSSANPRLKARSRVVLPADFKDGGPLSKTVTVAAPRRPQPAPPREVAAAPPPVVQPPVTTPATSAAPPPSRSASTTAGPRPYSSLYPNSRPTIPPASGAPAIVESSTPPSDSDVAAAGRGRFEWPLRGRLLAGFGPKGAGQRNDGVDLAAGMGESVRAAAGGEVVYSGNQVPGFGNLVLVKHDGGWVTAYAHLQKASVKNRDRVVQGQEIGQVGDTGGVDQPQLHFEIRYAPSPKDKARPVDPTLVLPK